MGPRKLGPHNTSLVKQDTNVLLRPTNLRSFALGRLEPEIMKILLLRTGFNSLSQYNLVNKSIPIPQEMKILDAKAAVDKGSEKLEKIVSMASDECKEQKRGHRKGTREGKTVHFATLMGLCHLKNLELEQKFQKIQRARPAPR